MRAKDRYSAAAAWLRIPALIGLLFLPAAHAAAKARNEKSDRVLSICVAAGGDTTALHWAQSFAAGLFRQIQVRIAWHIGADLCRAQCPSPIVITVGTSTPPNLHPGWLAYSLPFEGTHIAIFYDRIQAAVPMPVQRYVLAHVMVHEITHILQRSDRHEERGLMKKQWDAADYVRMPAKQLEFSDSDIDQIYRGIEARRWWAAAIPRGADFRAAAVE